MSALEGITVLDFSRLVPGPLATRWLADAGARVIKVERPGTGDEMRHSRGGDDSPLALFAQINAGKLAVSLDLQQPGALDRLAPLIQETDILVEQFRPGVMARLGLDYASVAALNPGLIYCSISGYGQTGPKRLRAGHDLNYLADTGMASLAVGPDGTPSLPPAMIADIGGGSLPAVVNILLALIRRQRTGEGAYLDVAMTDNVFAWMTWGLGNAFGAGRWPRPGAERLTGGIPRYGVYRTRDGRYLAVGALEDRFWRELCDVVGLSPEEADDRADPEGVRRRLAARIESRTAAEWEQLMAGRDTCTNLVLSLEEAVADPHHRGRGLFDRRVETGGKEVPLLPSVVVAPNLAPANRLRSPDVIGADNRLLSRSASKD